MTDPIFDDELEPSDAAGRSQIWMAAICVALSAACCVLWIVTLISPRVFH